MRRPLGAAAELRSNPRPMQPNLLSEPLRLAGAPILRLQSDERLVRLVRAGSHPAFAEIVHRYRPALVRYTGRLVGAERAEDVVQQGLASAHTALMSDERPIDLKPWLYRIVHNSGLNVLRGDREIVGLDDHADALVAPSVETQAEQRERFRSTLRAVEALPTAQRDALLLRELEGRSHDEIAVALGVSPGAARQHLMRARVTMRAAVTALTPYPLVIKLAALGAGSAAGLPAAEAVTGAGFGFTLTKLGAGVLAAGALAGGAGVVVPAMVPKPPTEQARGAERPARATGAPRPVGAELPTAVTAGRARTAAADPAAGGDERAATRGEDRRRRGGDRSRGRDGERPRGGDDEPARRGPDGADGRRGGDAPSSGRDGRPGDGGSRGPGDGSDRDRRESSGGGPGPSPGGSGPGGGDDPASRGDSTSGSGSDGADRLASGGEDRNASNVSTSGSGTSGPGSFGSGTSGSGSAGSGTSGSGTSGSGTSGSGSSGSGTSGSGSSSSSGSGSGSTISGSGS